MSDNKTTANDGDVSAFIAGVENDGQRADTEQLVGLMAEASGQPASMWGGSIVGFGSTHYTYATGREGDTATIGFSPRKGKFALYTAGSFRDHSEVLDRLGKYEMGAGCLYIKRLSDVDTAALADLLKRAYEAGTRS
jgi:hypothetical protein